MNNKVTDYDKNNDLKLKYQVYCLDFLTMDIDDIIDSEYLTYEEFCKRYYDENIKQ